MPEQHDGNRIYRDSGHPTPITIQLRKSPQWVMSRTCPHGRYPSAHIHFLTCRAPAWRGVPVKKAAAEASMQRSKKARMVALFVVINHVMCLFPVLGGGVAVPPSCVSGQKRHAESTVRTCTYITLLRRRPCARTNARRPRTN